MQRDDGADHVGRAGAGRERRRGPAQPAQGASRGDRHAPQGLRPVHEDRTAAHRRGTLPLRRGTSAVAGQIPNGSGGFFLVFFSAAFI